MIPSPPNPVKDTERFRILILLGLGVGFAYLFFLIAQPFVLPAIWALIVVTTSWPLYRRLTSRLQGRRTLSAFLMTAFAFVLILGIIGPLFSILAREVGEWRNEGSSPIEQLTAKLPELKDVPLVNSVLGSLGFELKLTKESLVGYLRSYHSELATWATSAASKVVSAFTTLLLCLFFSFFLYRDAEYILRHGRRFFVRIGGDRFREILQTCRDTVRGAVYGTLATAIAQGMLGALGYFAVGNRFPILLGFLTAASSFIPFGAPVIYVPVALSLFASGNAIWGVALLIWGVAVVSTSDNVLRTVFISQSTEMPVVLVFIGIVGGALTFGFLGLVLGPVIMAVAQGLWLEWCSHSEVNQPSEIIT